MCVCVCVCVCVHVCVFTGRACTCSYFEYLHASTEALTHTYYAWQPERYAVDKRTHTNHKISTPNQPTSKLRHTASVEDMTQSLTFASCLGYGCGMLVTRRQTLGGSSTKFAKHYEVLKTVSVFIQVHHHKSMIIF